jgi:hypothetical protein
MKFKECILDTIRGSTLEEVKKSLSTSGILYIY